MSSDEPVTVFCVLREGGDYTWAHVERLREQVKANVPEGTPFVCLNRSKFPGWWAKMDLFRELGPALYLDLDTTITGDLTPLLRAAKRYEFVCLRDFNFPTRYVQSSVMAWNGDLSHLWERFNEDPLGHMDANASKRWWGDQGFIERHQVQRVYWQDILPGACVSWKKNCSNGVPDGARVVVFHGRPRPWEVGR